MTEEEVVAEWKTTLVEFSAGEGAPSVLSLPPMNSFKRHVVHGLADELGLLHASSGAGKAKCVVLERPAAAVVCGSPAFRDLPKFEMHIEGGVEHPDPEYAAFRSMRGASIGTWDGGCWVTAVRRAEAKADGADASGLGAGCTLGEWVPYCLDDDGLFSDDKADEELLGKMPVEALEGLVLGSRFCRKN